MATCEQTAPEIPRGTSGRGLTDIDAKIVCRCQFLDVFFWSPVLQLAFFFHPTGKFHEGKDHPAANPCFPWGHETPSISIFCAEVKSSWPGSIWCKCTYTYFNILHSIFCQKSLLMVPTGPLRDAGKLLCLEF